MHKLFDSQIENEKIYLVVRQHWLVLTMRLGLVFFMFALLTALWFWLDNFFAVSLPPAFFTVLDILYFVAMFGLLLSGLLVIIFYYLHLQIITDMRMVDVDQLGLFRRNVSEIFIENVEEPTSMAHGFLATFLDYGDVTVQTSGSKIEFVFEKVPHPESIKKLILDLYERRSQILNPRRPTPTPPSSPTHSPTGVITTGALDDSQIKGK